MPGFDSHKFKRIWSGGGVVVEWWWSGGGVVVE